MPTKLRITAERLREVLFYTPDTGVFTWKTPILTANGPRALAGTFNYANGYFYIQINRVQYLVHRLAWLFVFGEWPSGHIDHINRDRTDNRISNLREATRSENLHNTGLQSNNSSTRKGVYWHKKAQKWAACITVDRRKIHLGLFPDIDKAADAYDSTATLYRKDFAGTNFRILESTPPIAERNPIKPKT